MREVSFLHCADIHLGYLQYNETERASDFAAAFRQVVIYALERQVDFVLISGDFFHKRAINAETLQQAVELLAPLKEADIPVVAIEGNHDKAFYQDKGSWLGFLNKQKYLYLLTPFYEEGRLVLLPWDEEVRRGSWLDLKGVRIYGAGYLGVTTPARVEEAAVFLGKKEQFTVFMLHSAVNMPHSYDLGGLKSEQLEILRGKVDYVALGHVHSRYETGGWLYNPGSLECVHLDEYAPDKEKGFYHVTLRQGAPTIQYIPSRFRQVARYTLDLSGTLRPEEASALIFSHLSAAAPAPGAQVQILLTGEIPFNPLNLDLNEMAQKLKEKFSFLYVELKNNLNLPVVGSLEKDGLIKREDLERHVFAGLLAREKHWTEERLAEAVTLVQRVKSAVLTGEEEAETIKLLLQAGERLLGDEPAAEDLPAKTRDVQEEAV
ncbi:MAG: exonuclease SbcCD subunit D [Clostridia bacterium]|nr:exonuclease SbcCD subunit D [Clostridia bacterium]